MRQRIFRNWAISLIAFLLLSVFASAEGVMLSVAVTADSGGDATVSAMTVELGATVTIKAIPKPGYRFEHWEVVNNANVDLDESRAEQSITVEEDLELKAHFEEDLYRVTVELLDQEGGSFSFEDRMFSPGAEVTVQAFPYEGFSFAGWQSEDLELENASEAKITFTMPGRDVILSADFQLVTYRFRILTGAGGTAAVDGLTPNSRGEYECHFMDEIELLAEPQDNFLFSGWAATNGATFSDAQSASTTLICPASDFTVRAQFASSIKELTVTSTEGGSVSPQEGKIRFGVDNILELLAVPEEGYVFLNWECTSSEGKFSDPKSASATFTMPDADCTVTAVFGKGGYRLTVLPTVGGRIDESSAGNYEMGEQISINATPEEGYEFIRWEADAEGVLWDETSPSTVVTMPGKDVKVTAIFALKGGAVLPGESGEKDDAAPRSFPWIPLIIVLFLSAVAIVLIIIRERFNLSYRYLIRKWIRSLSKK